MLLVGVKRALYVLVGYPSRIETYLYKPYQMESNILILGFQANILKGIWRRLCERRKVVWVDSLCIWQVSLALC